MLCGRPKRKGRTCRGAGKALDGGLEEGRTVCVMEESVEFVTHILFRKASLRGAKVLIIWDGMCGRR